MFRVEITYPEASLRRDDLRRINEDRDGAPDHLVTGDYQEPTRALHTDLARLWVAYQLGNLPIDIR